MSKKISVTAMCVAFAVILSYLESFIPAIGIPGVKLGLANFAIVITLYLVGTREAIICNILRIVIVGAMFGSLFSIFYSIAGAVTSFIVMIAMKKINKFSIITISICGGVFHNIGQLIVAAFLVETYSIFYYVPVLIIAGIITGLLIGVLSGTVIDRLRYIIKIQGV